MTRSKPTPSITRLSFQRKWMLAKLDCGGLTTTEEVSLIDILEQLDLNIAATPCDMFSDLCLKLDRLADLLCPSNGSIPKVFHSEQRETCGPGDFLP